MNETPSTSNQTTTLSNFSINTPRRTSAWLVLALLFLFPPAALYFIWKETGYHRWFAYLLWLSGGYGLIMGIIQFTIVLPRLLQLYQDFNADVDLVSIYGSAAAPLVFGVVGMFLGVIDYHKVSGGNRLSGIWLGVTLVWFGLSYLFTAYAIYLSMYSAILPIYNLTTSLQ